MVSTHLLGPQRGKCLDKGLGIFGVSCVVVIQGLLPISPKPSSLNL